MARPSYLRELDELIERLKKIADSNGRPRRSDLANIRSLEALRRREEAIAKAKRSHQ